MEEKIKIMLKIFRGRLDDANKFNDHAKGLVNEGAVMVLENLSIDIEKISHQDKHILLHRYLDELVADFIKHTEKLPSKTTIMELIEWAYGERIEPTETETK